MRKNGKLLAALISLLLLCALCLPALAEEVQNVKYIEYKWDGKKLTSEEKTCTATKLTGDEETLETGWYVTAGDVSFSRRPVVSGDVGLILADGYTVKAEYGITVEGNNTLSIYAQREGEGMGALTVSGQNNYDAGIGGAWGNNSGLITIHGGAVTATAKHGAGIGGGGSNNGQGGSGYVTIYGGTITATANMGAGIGGGVSNNGQGGSGDVTIHGGTVMATTSGYGAGIGGGNGYAQGGNGKVTIYGGAVTATANEFGAGIGGGGSDNGQGSDGTVEIYGGTVTATANYTGAGIGGGGSVGGQGGDGKITIHGGTVTATGYYGAGIGGGDGGTGSVTISGGTVTATARNGAAIGNGNRAGGGEVTITGGRVSAVNTKTNRLSIGGDGCAVSLGWKDADDYVTAAGYTGSVKLTKDFLIAGTTTMLPAGEVDISKIAGQMLLPNRSRTVRCIGYEWDEGKKRLTRKIHSVPNPRPLTGTEITLTGGETEEEPVWYRVSGPVTLSARPEVKGWVNLILMDGCDLRAEKGITVNWGDKENCENFLSIFAQSDGTIMGALTVPEQSNNAGIGGTNGNSSGLITIHGGTVTATAEYGAGIGGGSGGAGTVTIHGGTVTATATANSHGAGIGGGLEGKGTVEISGGTVTATASYSGAGIGGGAGGSGTVEIHGGTVTAIATANSHGAGIGGGYDGSGTIEISGGKVTATASGSGAGIGGGLCVNEKGGNGEVTIEGGTVTATASGSGAAIGGGRSHNGEGGSGTVTISGGTVTATASGSGAAIGNGYNSYGGSVTVTGGSVSAVHTAEPSLSIGGGKGECTVSLGLTKKNDSVYAAGYAAKDSKVTLTAALQDAGKGEKFPDGDVPAGDVARKLLIPDTEEAAGQQAWRDKAVDFRLPGSLTGIGSGAFQNIRAATVLVPVGVKKIGPDAFRGSGVKRIKFENGNPETFDASAFADCPFVIVYTPAQGKVYDALKEKANVYLMLVK